jgi:hypothetical protein
VLTGVEVNLRVGEVGEPAGVVEVEVGHHDVPNRFRGNPQATHLIEGDSRQIVPDPEVGTEQAHHARWVRVIPEPEARVDEHGPLVSLDKQSSAAQVPVREPRGHRRAIQNPKSHGSVPLLHASWRAVHFKPALSEGLLILSARRNHDEPFESRTDRQRPHPLALAVGSE